MATTDLSAGRLVTWDIGALAASGLADRWRAVVEIVLASSAPPGIVEPVALPDPATGVAALHGDGGVKRPLLVEPALFSGAGDTLWVVANGHVSARAATWLERDSLPALARRGVSQLLRSLIYQSVDPAYGLARERGAAFRLMRLPDDEPEARNPFRFEPAEMRRLFARGRALGAAGGLSPPPCSKERRRWWT